MFVPHTVEPFVVEVQLSPLTVEDVHERTGDYNRAWVRCCGFGARVSTAADTATPAGGLTRPAPVCSSPGGVDSLELGGTRRDEGLPSATPKRGGVADER